MAVQGIFPPKFSTSHGHLATEWKEFKEQLDMYFVASGQSKIADKQKVSLLLYQMGRQYVKVYNNDFKFTDAEDKDKYDVVVKKFDEYFEPKKLLKSHITRFQKRVQLPNESISTFITELRQIAKLCAFGANEDTMLAVQISNGVHDPVLRKKLWDEDLSLTKVIEKCQTWELRSQSADLYSNETKDVNAAYGKRVNLRGRGSSRGRSSHRGNRRGRGSSYSQGRGRGRSQNSHVKECGNCGSKHPPKRCPAYNEECNYCHKFNHFEKMCRTKQREVNSVEIPECEFEEEFVYEPLDINTLSICAIANNTTAKNAESDPWSIILPTPYQNRKVAVKMKIDTQAHCNTLSKESFQRLSKHVKLKVRPSNATIKAFGNSIVVPIGKTNVDFIVKQKQYSVECEIIDGQVPNLLGAVDSERLGLVRRVYSMSQQKPPQNLSQKENCQKMKQSIPQTPPTHIGNDESILKRIPNVEKVPPCILEIIKEFSDRFPEDRVGKIPGEWSLSIDPEYKDGPVSFGARPLPAAMKNPTKGQLDYMAKNDIITKVPKGVPTPWCSQLHVVHKKDGKSVRTCIDPKFLNRALLREYHPIKTLEDVLTQVEGCKYFTVLDANMGFFQIQLDKQSQLLTCFNTPWGRYMYKRLPMGIKSAPEIYQRAIEEMYQGMENFHNIFDDILLPTVGLGGQCQVLRKTLQIARENDLTFRLSKCIFAQPKVDYTGSILTDKGVKASTEKVRAIVEMKEPQSKEQVHTLLGMATYLSKYIPNFSQMTEPLRAVIKKNEKFFFDQPQKEAFESLKRALSQAPVMKYYSLKEPIVVSCDASMGGLGCVMLQDNHPVAYGSKTLTQTERAYAQIEKELLAIVFACKKFHHLLYGRDDITVETDHLPLVSIINKPLDQVPMRLQKMILQLQPYQFKLVGKRGKDIPVPDALSRAPIDDEYKGLIDDMREFHVCATEIKSMHVFSNPMQEKLKKTTAQDPVYHKLSSRVISGWPRYRSQIEIELRPYWDFRDEISVYDGILFKGEKVMIPKPMQAEVLKLLHSSHQGMVRTKQLGRDVVYWRGMNSQIEDEVSKCGLCQEMRNQQQKEPMLSTELPTLPWEYVSSDLFDVEGETYLTTVDHYSGYIELDELPVDHTSPTVIAKLKRIFATHGIPKKVYSDGGPQFISDAFKSFAKTWGFETDLFSARHPQANGMAERAVQTCKRLVKKAKKDRSDIQLALLDFRNTPRDSFLGSPVQRCMGRRTRTRLPVCDSLLKPQVIKTNQVTERLKEIRTKSKSYYDKQAKPLKELNPGDTIRIRKDKSWVPAQLVSKSIKPRRYNVRVPSGRVIIRNRKHILRTKEKDIFDPARIEYRCRNEVDELPTPSQNNQICPPEIRSENPTPQANATPNPNSASNLNSAPNCELPSVNNPGQHAPIITHAPHATGTVTTRSGRISKPPDRFGYSKF